MELWKGSMTMKNSAFYCFKTLTDWWVRWDEPQCCLFNFFGRNMRAYKNISDVERKKIMIKIEIDDVTVNNTRCCLFILSGLFLPLPIRVVLFNDSSLCFISSMHHSFIKKNKECYVDFSDILFFIFILDVNSR